MNSLAKGIISNNKGYLDDDDFPDLVEDQFKDKQNKQYIKIFKDKQKQKQKKQKQKQKESVYDNYKIEDYKENKQEIDTKMQRVILWLRNDLRLHDNYVFDYAVRLKRKKEVIAIYVYDDLFMKQKTEFMSQKVGMNRIKFIHESVEDIKMSLQGIQSDLYVGYGSSEQFITQFIKKDKEYENVLVFQKEECSEEIGIEKKVISSMKSVDQQLKVVELWGQSIYNVDDMKVPVDKTVQSSYSNFRKKTDGVQIRELVSSPCIGSLPLVRVEGMDQYLDYDHSKLEKHLGLDYTLDYQNDSRSSLDFKGGETSALERMNHYIWKYQGMKDYKTLRNGFYGSNFSSKFSPFLAQGSISPRLIQKQIRKWEKENEVNKHSIHFRDELFWRDFYIFWGYVHSPKIFYEYGYKNVKNGDWNRNEEIIRRWKEGRTGLPIIDAIQRDLLKTGYISNRARQMTAAYLTLDLEQDWRYGAYHFEQHLLDYDPCSNQGGWSAASGLGPGKTYSFHMIKQAHQYDYDGHYVRRWVDELVNVSNKYIHEPWKMNIKEQKQCGVIIGQDYQYPIQCDKYTKDTKLFDYKRY